MGEKGGVRPAAHWHSLAVAGVVQLDEPYLQARSDKAKRFAIPAINRALEGIEGITGPHTCFGYAHIVHDRPNGYPFLAELAHTTATQVSMESAQQGVDLSILRALAGKTVLVGVIDLAADSPVEDVEPSPPGFARLSGTSTPAAWSSCPTAG